MNWVIGHTRVVVSILLLTLASSSAAEAQDQQVELRRGAEELVKLIEKRDSAGLLKRFSEQGTSFIGTAYVPSEVSLIPDKIRQDFEGKRSVYCLFFDSECFRKEDSEERTRQNGRPLKGSLKSIFELLSSASEKRFVTYDISAQNGKVSVLLSKRTPDTARVGEDALNFYLRLEGGLWKLRNIEYN
jgi:hypothetical protein